MTDRPSNQSTDLPTTEENSINMLMFYEKSALNYRTRFAFTYTAFHDIGKIFIYIVKNKVFWDYFYFHQQLYLYANIPSWKIHANFFLNKKKIIPDQMTNTVINNLMVFIRSKTKQLFLRRRRQLLKKFRSSVSNQAVNSILPFLIYLTRFKQMA